MIDLTSSVIDYLISTALLRSLFFQHSDVHYSEYEPDFQYPVAISRGRLSNSPWWRFALVECFLALHVV